MTLDEIRGNIDQVDRQIRALFVERMALAEQVAQVKAQSADKIFKPDREAAIIEKNSKDMDPHLVMEYKALIKRIMEVSRKYQYGRTLKLRDCFPFTFLTEAVPADRPAVSAEEGYLTWAAFSQEELSPVLCADYNQGAELIKRGAADCGLGVIEQIGSGVNDALNTALFENDLYINECRVIRTQKGRGKAVRFSDQLVVLEDHNRLKLMFVAPNNSGALSSMLSMISDYGVNLTEIHSIPFKMDSPEGEAWNYYFYVELEANLLKEDIKALVFQLSQESQMLKLLGSYRCEGDF